MSAQKYSAMMVDGSRVEARNLHDLQRRLADALKIDPVLITYWGVRSAALGTAGLRTKRFMKGLGIVSVTRHFRKVDRSSTT